MELCVMQNNENMFSLDSPVFLFKSNKFLTTKKLITVLKELLCDLYVPGLNTISCHSFRAAIPSAISGHPNKIVVTDLKEWGNWKGDSLWKYTKNFRDHRK